MRIKRPDYKNASSIIEEAEKQMEFTLTLPINDPSAFTIIRNIYECFRMLGDALLVNEGIETIDHLEPINALLRIETETTRPIQAVDNLRRLRHNINYYGYHPTTAEANDAIDIAKSCFRQLLKEVQKKINRT